MTTYPGLPWSRINDYLLEVGAVRNVSEFGRRALLCLNDLLPFDGNGLFSTNDGKGRMRTHAALTEASKWVDLYDNYYWKAQPPLPGSKTKIVDWSQVRHTEYATDFIDPQGIGFSAGIYPLESVDNNPGGLVINRSKKSVGFSEREMLILEVIQPHLSNFYAINTLLVKNDICQLPDAATLTSNYKCLTKREAEIAALICCKFRTDMIASRLLISQLTVYRHIANIFEKLKVFNRDELVEKLVRDYSGGKEREVL